MTAYAEVDPIIDVWARANVKKLFNEWAGRPARFAYLPGLRPFECFQISIDAPLLGCITVHARSVDTDDESEFEQCWEGPIDTLPAMLEEATGTVQEWLSRVPMKGS
ncbi:hypothetical protein [Novosphingobium sp. KACC 22771]|uniref:hypothetical protein n=1 Tax=Novosphingobium sp. KACC 22771 TaxID=3025670 RepID=UPI00236650F7|nr:hypothetical protein [Novosphingobium sp. KACC 22771]WDF71481.1 hypothetical protein PQ467_11755 [Novosphingobium sp. KACC 22771]